MYNVVRCSTAHDRLYICGILLMTVCGRHVINVCIV